MWELDSEESWVLKNWCFWTVVLEKTLESPLDCKEILLVHPRGDQSWVSIGRTDAEAETPILWPPHVKNWLIGKDPNAGKDWGQEEKGMTEDEMVGWHHLLNGYGFGSWWWTGRPSVLQFMGSQRVGHDWATGLNYPYTKQEVVLIVLTDQSCPTLCDPMDCCPPGFSLHGILQARILEWVAIAFSRDHPNTGIEPKCPTLQADSLLSESPKKPKQTVGLVLFYNTSLDSRIRPDT